MGEEGVDLVGIRARAEGGGSPCGGQLEQGEKGVHMREEMVAEMGDLLHTGVLFR